MNAVVMLNLMQKLVASLGIYLALLAAGALPYPVKQHLSYVAAFVMQNQAICHDLGADIQATCVWTCVMPASCCGSFPCQAIISYSTCMSNLMTKHSVKVL